MSKTTATKMPAEFAETAYPKCNQPGTSSHAWDIRETSRRDGDATVDVTRCGYCGARMCRIIPDLDPVIGGQAAWTVRYAKS